MVEPFVESKDLLKTVAPQAPSIEGPEGTKLFKCVHPTVYCNTANEDDKVSDGKMIDAGEDINAVVIEEGVWIQEPVSGFFLPLKHPSTGKPVLVAAGYHALPQKAIEETCGYDRYEWSDCGTWCRAEQGTGKLSYGLEGNGYIFVFEIGSDGQITASPDMEIGCFEITCLVPPGRRQDYIKEVDRMKAVATQAMALASALEQKKATEELKEQMESLKQEQASAKQDAVSSVSLADEIKKLADLKQQGVLSEEEFAAGKAKILGQ